MKTKICTKCHKEYLRIKEYFPLDKQNKDGLNSWCKKCHNAISYDWNKKYKQTIIGCLRHKFYKIKDRCNNFNHPSYKNYGGRGIKCLFDSSQEFVDYVVNELQVDPRGLDTDRIDNDGNYEKGNIQFIIHAENNRNRRKWRIK